MFNQLASSVELTQIVVDLTRFKVAIFEPKEIESAEVVTLQIICSDSITVFVILLSKIFIKYMLQSKVNFIKFRDPNSANYI